MTIMMSKDLIEFHAIGGYIMTVFIDKDLWEMIENDPHG